ncbi:MAG: hypothetical protein JJU19_02890 [Pararhodobacter sp.]|nr:hypothetical protein [Pararhodobacter sp.]
MKLQTLSIVTGAGLFLAACGDMAGGQPETDPVTRALSGNTMTFGEVSIEVNPDGTLAGETPDGDLAGRWAVRDGQWCDTIVEPEAYAGTTCMDVELGDGEITFLDADGTPRNTWQIS